MQLFYSDTSPFKVVTFDTYNLCSIFEVHSCIIVSPPHVISILGLLENIQ